MGVAACICTVGYRGVSDASLDIFSFLIAFSFWLIELPFMLIWAIIMVSIKDSGYFRRARGLNESSSSTITVQKG
jgi:hypothetical protein